MTDRDDTKTLGAAIAFPCPPTQRAEIRLVVAALYARIEALEEAQARSEREMREARTAIVNLADAIERLRVIVMVTDEERRGT
jgi:hypothetical protein